MPEATLSTQALEAEVVMMPSKAYFWNATILKKWPSNGKAKQEVRGNIQGSKPEADHLVSSNDSI